MNHSFNSNCLTTAYDFEIAIRDIQPDEQLTDDYGYLNIEVPFKPIDEGTRRRIVYPDDTLRYHKVWDKKIASAFPLIDQLDQPLSNVISKETWECDQRCERRIKRVLDFNYQYLLLSRANCIIAPARVSKLKIEH